MQDKVLVNSLSINYTHTVDHLVDANDAVAFIFGREKSIIIRSRVNSQFSLLASEGQDGGAII